MKIKLLAVVAALLALTVIGFWVYQILILRKAHSAFDNYYAFRGCAQLLSKTDSYGLCRLSSGQIIKIVEFRNGWYLDGDFPRCLFGVCL
ncbi:hypothetical protein M1513_00615 [Patescibacteria group bacterium]|nr:hypothetical protein [Patescibacteria group bacterium]MCL5733533.1 hypothetical protein [Patescibacteria group bacterium]